MARIVWYAVLHCMCPVLQHSVREYSGAMVERSVKDAPPLSRFQFERIGYFCVDPGSSSDKVCVCEWTHSLTHTHHIIVL